MTTHLRPIERRVLDMRQSGMSDDEIGRRFRKSPDRVSAIADWARIPGRTGVEGNDHLLSPIQRRVLAMRSEGQTHAEIGRRFRRSERYVRQVEGLAYFRQYRELLG